MSPFPTPRVEKKLSPCAYPGCVNFKADEKGYCCQGCRWDHADTQDVERTEAKLEQDPVITFSDVCLGYAEAWLRRAQEAGVDELVHYNNSYVKQMWLVLLNGAFLCTDKDTGPRYRVESSAAGGPCYLIVDGHTLALDHFSMAPSKYVVIARTHKKLYADHIVKALNGQGVR